MIRSRSPLATTTLLATFWLVGAIAATASPLGPPNRQIIRLERVVLNLDRDVIPLESTPPPGVLGLPRSDEIFYGTITRRLPGDGQSSHHYVPYAVRYRGEVAVQAWCDLNDDQNLRNDAEIPLHGHPLGRNARSFLVDLSWTARNGGREFRVDRKMRVVLEPVVRGEPPRAHEQMVWGMRGRIPFPGGARDLLLHDGNADGIYTKEFGDGFFVDYDEDRRIDMNPTSPHFGPMGVAFQMGDRMIEVEGVDPEGSYLILVVRSGAEPIRPKKIGELAPDFEYHPIAGGPSRLTDYRGSHVALYFWATWCGTCAAQAPALVELEKTYRERGLRILGVSFDTDRVAMERFRKEHGETWPTTFSGHQDWEDPIGRIYRMDGPGVICLITPDGRLEGTYVDVAELRARLDELFQPGAVSEEGR
jgi:thiol-disulfide isomerase/thioredoxin